MHVEATPGELGRDQQAIGNELLHYRPIAVRAIDEGLYSALAQRVHGGDGQQIMGETTGGREGVPLVTAQELQVLDVPPHDLKEPVEAGRLGRLRSPLRRRTNGDGKVGAVRAVGPSWQ